MKNIDMDRINNLLDLFCGLDDVLQMELIGKAFELTLKQTTMKNQYEQGKFDYEKWKMLKNKYYSGDKTYSSMQIKELEKTVNDELSSKSRDLIDMHSNVIKLDDEGKAVIVMMMEKLKPGSFTKIEELSVNITEKHISMEEYITKNLPNADFQSVKRKFDEMNEQV